MVSHFLQVKIYTILCMANYLYSAQFDQVNEPYINNFVL